MKTKPDSYKPLAGSPENLATSGCRRFLVPIDFSEESLKALRHAHDLAAGGKAELTLLNVIEEPLSFRTLDRVGQQHARKKERLARLEGLAQEETGSGISVKTLVCDGSPAKEITRFAAQTLPDMIIVGRHEHHGFGRWFHGHTASRLARQAPCTLIVLGN